MTSQENHEIELELTYLAAFIPAEINGLQPVELVDVYIPEAIDVHSRLRLRQKGDKFEATKKLPISDGDASAHTEHTIPLDRAEFDALSSVSDKRIEKARYCVELGGFPAEVDVFKGLLEGLVVIDFEFKSEEAKKAFVPTSHCLADVTQEDFIAGGQLAGKSYDDIVPHLSRFDYTKLTTS